MKEKIAILSIFVNLILAIGKLIVGFLTKSASVLAEGVHSGMDVISSIVSLIGIKISKKPVDKKYPYGHYKYEVISGLFITILLFMTGLWIMYKSYIGFLNPKLVSISYLALWIMLLSAILNEIMARLKIHFGKKENSLSLLSDGVHDRVDVYTSIVVLIGLVIMPYWIYVDSILALLIGLYIIKESFELGKEATNSLLDVYAGDEVESKIIKIIERHNIEYSELKTLKKGAVITANFTIKLDKSMNVDDVSKITSHLRRDLISEIENLAYVAIQVESHEINENYFKPKDMISKVSLGKGFGWNNKGRMEGFISGAKGLGPEGSCICSKCGYEMKHKKGVPCSSLKCPKCDINMTRK